MISIIIINFNTFELTSKCIRSVINHTLSLPFEIILVDNASKECAPEKFKEIFPSIILVKSEINSGFSKGNNLGIQQSKGDVILLLNSDTELTEDSISICYNELLKQENVAAITCKLLDADNSVQHNCQSFPSAIKIIFEKIRIHKFCSKQFKSDYLQGFYWDYNKAGFPDWIWGTFFMFKKSVLQKLPDGKLNDQFFMYIEDIKWCFDFKKIELKMFYTPETAIIHYSGGSGGKKNEMLLKNFQRLLDANYNILSKTIINLLNK